MFCISLANLRKWVKIPYNLLSVNEEFSDKPDAADDRLSQEFTYVLVLTL